MMQTVGTQDAERNFAAILRKVKAGEEFLVMEDGATVARIVPCALQDAERHAPAQKLPEAAESLDDIIAALRQGGAPGAGHASTPESRRMAVQAMLDFPKVPLVGTTIAEMRDFGRRY